MLVTLLAWIYITYLCAGWGSLFFKFIQLPNANQNDGFFYIQCITGMAAIASLLGIVSFFTYLYNPFLHLFFITPVILLSIRKELPLINYLKEWLNNLNWPIKILFISLLLLLLVISSYKIIHPDTLTYHAQIIRWLGYYKITPGIVHLDRHLGLQSNWFVASSFFSFAFTGIKSLTFLNTAILVWFFGFIVSRINFLIKKSRFLHTENAFLFFLLLVATASIYTQVRLTASSASPDFPAALFVLLAGYLFLNYAQSSSGNILHALFICFFALTIKLSNLVILLLIPFLIYECKDKIRAVAFTLIFFTTVSFPFLARNTITSGHALYPIVLPVEPLFDWSYPQKKCIDIQHYILSYARVYDENEKNTSAILKMHFSEWITIWWKKQPIGNKIMLVGFCVSVVLLLLLASKRKKLAFATWVVVSVSLAGIFFWFVNAPDPRFGMAFILLFQGIIYYNIFEQKIIQTSFIFVKKIYLACYAMALLVFLYSAYRFIFYFKPYNLIQAGTIEYKPNVKIEKKWNMLVHVIPSETECGDIKPPCLFDFNTDIEARGKNIEDGFRSNAPRKNN